MKKRARYTYIPNSEIESITTWNGVEIKGSQLLDGAYARGKFKFANGGVLQDDYFKKQSALKGGIKYFSVEVDTQTGENIRDLDFNKYEDAKIVYDDIADTGIVYSEFSKSSVNAETLMLVVVYRNGDYDVLESKHFEEEYAMGGKMAFGGMATKTIEQQAQELIGDEWYSMNDEQRATSVTEFITSGVISSRRRFAEGGTIRDEFLYIYEENQPNVDYYEDVDYLTIFSSDKDEIEAIASYLQIPYSKIKIEPQTETFFIQIDKDGSVMAKGGGVKEAGGFLVTFTVGGKKIKKNFSTQEDVDAGIADFYMENVDVENVEIEEKKKPTPALDVFKAAKEEKKTGKKDEADKVQIDGVEDKISRIAEITKAKKSLEAEEKLLKGELKELAREKFIEKYEQMGRRPDNFRIVDGDENILFIVQDNYIKVTEEKMALLNENYPELLSESVSYKISELMLKKEGKDGRLIGEIISDLIGRSRDITDEDKANLFTITREVGIKDGAIEKLADYDNIEEVYNIIQPIEALK